MAKKSLALGVILLAYPYLSLAEPTFQRAQSEVERALDAIVMKGAEDNDMTTYLLREGSGKDDEKYAAYFTPAFKASVIKEQRKQCGGKKPTNDCIFEISPVSCSQEVPESYYLYQTQHLSNTEATVAYAWPETDKAIARYRLLKEKAGWKVDGVECVGGPKFNMK